MATIKMLNENGNNDVENPIFRASFSRGGLRRGNAETIALNCRLRAAASRRKKDWEEEVTEKAREMGGEAFLVAKMDVKEHGHLSLYSGRSVVGATGNKAVKFLKLPSMAPPITQVVEVEVEMEVDVEVDVEELVGVKMEVEMAMVEVVLLTSG